MSIRFRIFLGILAVIVVGFSFLVRQILGDLEPEYRKATEEPLVDSARIMASAAAATASNGKINTSAFRHIFGEYYARRDLYAKIYDYVKKENDLRVYITDSSGVVLFDSYDGKNEGRDFSRWLDVYRTLRGEYGARTTRDIPGDPSTTVMYVASPIIIEGKIAGVLSVGKPTLAARQFTDKSKNKIVLAGVVIILSMLLVVVLLSGMITRPVRRLTEYAKAVRDGKKVDLPALGTSEIAELGAAFEEMRDAVEGKQYIERYVQTLTHEVKGPLSAIKGATELLSEKMQPEQQKTFIDNIRNESERIESIVEKLLLLSSIESRKTVREAERIDMREIVDNIRRNLHPLIERKRLLFLITGDDSCAFTGDPFLVGHAVDNLVRNALDFSPEGGRIVVNVFSRDGYAGIEIRDNGPGIPDYALEKVFERFYSLKRPDTGRKSSGLGLSLVREIALLHNGSVEISNAPDGGVKAVLVFPTNPR